MTYATQTDMTERFSALELAQITDRVNGTVIDTTVLGNALSDADAEIDGYLATRYVLPLASIPPLLVRLGCEIARYRLYPDAAPTQVRDRYDDAVALLKLMAKGDVQVAGSTPLQAATVTGYGNAVATKTAQPVFCSDLLAKY